MGRLDGKVAIVTGGAGTIGRAIVERFVGEGARVLVADIDGDGIGALIGRLGHNQVDGAQVDVRDEAGCERMVAQAVRRFGRLDVAVNAAGSDTRPISIIDEDAARFREVIDVLLVGTFLSMKHEARRMIALGNGGSIVNFGQPEYPLQSEWPDPAYAAAESAIGKLVRIAALQLRPHGIDVNGIGIMPWGDTSLPADELERRARETAQHLADAALDRADPRADSPLARTGSVSLWLPPWVHVEGKE